GVAGGGWNVDSQSTSIVTVMIEANEPTSTAATRCVAAQACNSCKRSIHGASSCAAPPGSSARLPERFDSADGRCEVDIRVVRSISGELVTETPDECQSAFARRGFGSGKTSLLLGQMPLNVKLGMISYRFIQDIPESLYETS